MIGIPGVQIGRPVVVGCRKRESWLCFVPQSARKGKFVFEFELDGQICKSELRVGDALGGFVLTPLDRRRVWCICGSCEPKAMVRGITQPGNLNIEVKD